MNQSAKKDDIKKRDREIFDSQTRPDIFHASFAAMLMYEKLQNWMARWIISQPDYEKGLKCLDIGCGIGVNSKWLGNYGSLVIGIDHSKARVKSSNNRLPDRSKFHFLVADGEMPPVKESSFDIIFCAAILHHLPNYDSALISYKQCLKSTGIILASESCAFNPFAVIRRKFFPSETHTPDEKPFRPKNLIEEFRKKYDDVHYKRFYLFSVNSPLVERLFGRRAAVLYYKIFSEIDKLFLKIPIIKEFCWLICLVGFTKPETKSGK